MTLITPTYADGKPEHRWFLTVWYLYSRTKIHAFKQKKNNPKYTLYLY